MHTFELSGLGKAPFTVVTANEAKDKCNVFWCEHCGTGIKNRNFVKSSDDQVSVVGIDCLQKTGDAGLIMGEKRLKRQIKSQEQEAKRKALMAEKEEAEKQLNGGKTNAELANEIESSINDFIHDFGDQLDDDQVVQSLTQGGFVRDMQHQAYEVRPYSPGQLNALKNAYTKILSGGARANSAKFKEAAPQANEAIDLLQEKLTKAHSHLDVLRDKAICLRNNYALTGNDNSSFHC